MEIFKVFIISAVLTSGGCLQDVSVLNLSDDPDVQVEQVLQFIQPNKSIYNYTQLYQHLRQTLEPVWPGFKIVPSGSLVSNLEIETSDVDLLIIIPNTTTKAEDIARHAYELFERRPDIYGNVKLLTNKRVPIVMFRHIPSGFHSDLTFSGLPSIRISELIGYLMNIDHRAANLTKLVKYWSKIHNLEGVQLISSYAHYLQVIFFLQIKHILPPVIDMQKNISGLFNNWNTAFEIVEYTTSNNESVYQLLGGYFKFYSVFDYDRFIVSPYVGRMLEKSVFKCLDTVPDDFSLYQYNVLNGITKPFPLEGRISIQDPFEHNRNAGPINEESIRKAISHFKYAAKMFVDDTDGSFLRTILIRHADSELINCLDH